MSDVMKDSPAKTQVWLKIQLEKAVHMAPCVLVLDHLDIISNKSTPQESTQFPNRMKDIFVVVEDQLKASCSTVFLIATAREVERIDDAILDNFHHQILVQSPSESDRLEMLRNLSDGLYLSPEVSLKDISQHTASFVAQDLAVLLFSASESALRRATGQMYVINL